jgi:hypothetical protein
MQAMQGDVCLVKIEDGKGQVSLALCSGAVCAAPGDEGLMHTSLDKARIAWEI